MVQVLAPRAGVAGMIASLLRLGVVLIDVVSGAGAITKYTIGPAWTGAEFATIPDAVTQIVADAHSGSVVGQVVQVEMYPGVYADNVTIPETMPRFVFVGAGATDASGATDTGVTISGTFTVNVPPSLSSGSFFGLLFRGAFVANQAAPSALTTGLRFESCVFAGGFTVNSSASLGCSVQHVGCNFSAGSINVTARSLVWKGCSFGNVGCTVTCDGGTNVETSSLGNLLSTANTWSFSGALRARMYNCDVGGRLVMNAPTVAVSMSSIYTAGSPAVTDGSTFASFCQGNTFVHDAGPAGAAWVKTNVLGNFHDGGNNFVEGWSYPWYSLPVGATRSDRAESDNELRRVITRAGSPILTPAEVGSQRKTTIAKVNGGGVVTLPLAAQVEPGCTLVVKDLNGNATASPFTVVPQGADLIDGGAVPSVATDYGAVTIQQVSTTDWAVIGRYL